MFAARVEQPYPVIATRIDPRSPEYRANHEANAAAVDKLTQALADATVGGGEKYTSRHKAAGKLLPRERIELLLDRDSLLPRAVRARRQGCPGPHDRAPASSAASAASPASRS